MGSLRENRRTEVGGRKSEVRSQRTEIGCRKILRVKIKCKGRLSLGTKCKGRLRVGTKCFKRKEIRIMVDVIDEAFSTHRVDATSCLVKMALQNK